MRLLGSNNRGFSTVEVMVAGGLIAFLAVALLPAVFSLLESAKVSAFRTTCTAVVRAKLNEYINGVADSNTTALGYVPTGFDYTRTRFRDVAGICDVNTGGGSPGVRERVASNDVVADTAGQESSVGKGGIGNSFGGFQVYVSVRHFNPRLTVGGQAKRGCPATSYQFFRAGDGLEVVVTGMIRTTPTIANGGRGGSPFGNFSDTDASTPNPMLTCSVSQVIRPPSTPFRYVLGSDGKLRNLQASMTQAGGVLNTYREAMESHFRNLWSSNRDSFAAPGIANIRSLTVAPDNQSVYVLKPGMLSIYTSCDDETLTLGGSMLAIPNCDDATVTELSVDPNIENIAIDFRIGSSDDAETTSYPNDDQIYGLFTVGSSTSGNIRRLNRPGGWNVGAGAAWINEANYILPASRPRIRGMFMAPSLPYVAGISASLFFFDNTCYTASEDTGQVVNQSSFCATIFNSADSAQSMEVRELPVQAAAVSY